MKTGPGSWGAAHAGMMPTPGEAAVCPTCVPGPLLSPAFSLPFGSMVTFSFKVQLKGASSRKSSGAPLRPLRCPALRVLRGTAEREHLRPGPVWGEGAPPAHCSLLPSLASPHTGYLLALGPLLFISICDVWLQLFSRDQAYAINLAAVGTVAFGCTGRTRGGRGRSVCRGRVIQASQAQGWCVSTCTRACPLSHITHCTPTGLCVLGTQCQSTCAAHVSTRPGVSCGH